MTPSKISLAVVSVNTFLNVITHGQSEKAWVTCVPVLAGAPPGDWFGGRLDPNWGLGTSRVDNANNYYSLGLIKGNQRTLDKWEQGTVMVLDDVGEKSDDEGLNVRSCLGTPTFVIQTSKGSQQWGYVLAAAVKDMALMARLQRALTLKFYPSKKDPGHERVVQYLRLPCGVNNKPKRIAENGGVPFPVRLIEWNPDVRIDVLDAMQALGDAWDQTENLNVSANGGSAGPQSEKEAREYEAGDIVLQGLDKLNRVRWGDVRNGYIGVQCPWASYHTVIDDCEGYNPETRHYQCFHSTHGVKTREDISLWLKQQMAEQDAKEGNGADSFADLTQTAMRSTFGELPPDQSIYVSGSLRVVPTQPAKAPQTWVDIGRGAASTPMPMRRSICSHLARGEVTYRIGAPGMGKSAVSLGYALALTSDRPDLVGEKKFERTGDVIIVSNEDTAEDFRKRAAAWYKLHKIDVTKAPHRVIVNGQQGFVSATRDERNLPVRLGDDMKGVEEKLPALDKPCLLIIDTQAATFQNIEENDNGAMARAMALITGWAKTHDIAVEIVHHGLKANGRTDGAGELTSARGAGSAGGSVRNAVTVVGLSKEQQWKLPPGEGVTWLAEDGAKSNHGALSGRKWWQREIVDVNVVDLIDAPTVLRTQGMPVYVQRKKGPSIAFDANDDETVHQVVFAVREACAAGAELRVRRAKGFDNAIDTIADARSWETKDADAAIKAAAQRNMIRREQHQTQTRNTVEVWVPTEQGVAWLIARQGVLEQTDDEEAPF